MISDVIRSEAPLGAVPHYPFPFGTFLQTNTPTIALDIPIARIIPVIPQQAADSLVPLFANPVVPLASAEADGLHFHL